MAATVEEIDDDRVEFYADGYDEEANERAENCEHRVYRWTLHDPDADEWRKECVFCPAVLEQEFQHWCPKNE